MTEDQDSLDRSVRKTADRVAEGLDAVEKAGAVLRVAHEHYDADGDVEDRLWEVLTDLLNESGRSLTHALGDLRPEEIPF